MVAARKVLPRKPTDPEKPMSDYSTAELVWAFGGLVQVYAVGCENNSSDAYSTTEHATNKAAAKRVKGTSNRNFAI